MNWQTKDKLLTVNELLSHHQSDIKSNHEWNFCCDNTISDNQSQKRNKMFDCLDEWIHILNGLLFISAFNLNYFSAF